MGFWRDTIKEEQLRLFGYYRLRDLKHVYIRWQYITIITDQGRIQEEGVVITVIIVRCSCVHAQRIFPLYDVWGSPKRGVSLPTGTPPPTHLPESAPGQIHFNMPLRLIANLRNEKRCVYPYCLPPDFKLIFGSQ